MYHVPNYIMWNSLFTLKNKQLKYLQSHLKNGKGYAIRVVQVGSENTMSWAI